MMSQPISVQVYGVKMKFVLVSFVLQARYSNIQELWGLEHIDW